jgi:hypothetical protein
MSADVVADRDGAGSRAAEIVDALPATAPNLGELRRGHRS